MSIEDRMNADLDDAAKKAIVNLARYKFLNFGYWAGIWVHLNRISGQKRPSPFKALVVAARELQSEEDAS